MEKKLPSSIQSEIDTIKVTPIAKLETCFDEKFGVPRQSGIIPEAKGMIRFSLTEGHRQSLKGLDSCSHLWLLTWFHLVDTKNIKARVRPPRMGGDKSLGVFATRSPFRPNPIGLSLVELEKIEETNDSLILHVKGIDLVDQTPVLDIKPYLPYCESKLGASIGWLSPDWEKLTVQWSEVAALNLEKEALNSEFKSLVEAILVQDPRPAYQRAQLLDKSYGLCVQGRNVKFHVEDGIAVVESIH